MGLSPYGNGDSVQFKIFKEKILAELVDIREDGSMLLNMRYFDFATKLTMTNDRRWQKLFGVPRRSPESAIHQEHMDLALAIQEVTETIVLALVHTARKITGSKNLVMAGGVALNCVANSKILKAGDVDSLWIQPAAGDAGGALGAAYAAYHIGLGGPRKKAGLFDSMQYAYLGPEYTDQEIIRAIRPYEAKYEHFKNFDHLTAFVSEKLAEGNIIGWFQGRMEFGPRALGNRSILADPRSEAIQKKLNLKIKSREGFRPFAPSILVEDLSDWFTLDRPSPYMLLVASLKESLRYPLPENYFTCDIYERLYHIRSRVPAVTHVDYSSRIQTVSFESNPKFWKLLQEFKKLTGCGMLVNTSFNVRGEPIVCSPEDAYRGFRHSEMDYLVMGNYLFDRKKQSALPLKYAEKIIFPSD